MELMKPQGLENRLIDFAVATVGIVEELPESKAGNHLGGQIPSKIKSQHSTLANPTRKDWIVKLTLMEHMAGFPML